MWTSVVSSVKRVLSERTLPHRTLVNSQSLTFDSADVSPLHPTSLVSVQIYEENSTSSSSSDEAILTFKDANVTYKDKTNNNDKTGSCAIVDAPTKDTGGLKFKEYNAMTKSTTSTSLLRSGSGITRSGSSLTSIPEEDEVVVPESATNKSNTENLNESMTDSNDSLDHSGSSIPSDSSTELEKYIRLEEHEELPVSSLETDNNNNNNYNNNNNNYNNNNTEPIIIEEVSNFDEPIVVEIVPNHPPAPPTPKKIKTMQLTKEHKKQKIKRSKTSDTFYIKLGRDDSVDAGEVHETKGVVVDCTDYQLTVIPFILATAKALHTCGVPAHRMERMLTLLSNCFGVDAHFFYTPTGIFCSFNHPKPIFSKQKHTYMQFIRLPMVDWDLERLCFLEELCDDVIASRLHVSQGVTAIKDIMSLPLRYNIIFEICAVVVLSLGFAVLFGFSWSQSRACGLAGIWTGFMLSVARKYPSFAHINPVVSGVGAGIIVSLFSLYVTPVHTLLASIAALMYYLPSLDVTIAISEFVTGNLVAATARFLGCWAAILQVGFGSWTGITIVNVYSDMTAPLPDAPEKWYWVLFATFLASIGYSVLTQIPPKLLWVALVSGILGTIGEQVGTYFLNTPAGAFLGAFLICVFANLYARKVKRGLALIPIWSGMLLLVPASIGVKGLLYVSDLEINYSGIYLVTLLQNATALALGLFSANILANPYKAL